MSTNYPIGDFLVRFKNAALARKSDLEVQNIKLIEEVAKVLKKLGYVREIKKEDDKLVVGISYYKKEPVLLDLKLVSKPGLRIYQGVEDLEARQAPSFYILTTPEGILTEKEAIKKGVGGEVLAEIW